MSDEVENLEPQMIEFKCPYCGENTSFAEMVAGLPQECPFCMEILLVPYKSCDVGRRFPLPITTPRVILRRLLLDDSTGCLALQDDDELMRYLNWFSTDEERIYRWLQAEQTSKPSLEDRGLWLAIETQEGGKLIGMAGIRYLYPTTAVQGRIELVIGSDQQRKGYGLEAVGGLLEFGFHGVGLRRITFEIDSRNAAGMALAAKAGFRLEGTHVKDRFVKGEWVDTAYYAMLKDEYETAG
jgi:RimJ/RimL family protein N-acetyltransferase